MLGSVREYGVLMENKIFRSILGFFDIYLDIEGETEGNLSDLAFGEILQSMEGQVMIAIKQLFTFARQSCM